MRERAERGVCAPCGPVWPICGPVERGLTGLSAGGNLGKSGWRGLVFSRLPGYLFDSCCAWTCLATDTTLDLPLSRVHIVQKKGVCPGI